GTTKGTATLVSGVAHPSEASGALAAGTHAFKAKYFSDNPGSWTNATSSCESFTVNKADSSTVTEIHDASEAVVTSVPLGTTVHDKATVSSTNTSFTLGGTVDFTFYTSGDCTTGRSPAGTGIALVSGVAHPSSSEGPLSTAGSYS